ncbi:thioredoxin family protein [Aquimarina agarilytica]|uniref:thioredoxin family protein n=1 Tax=Aquimarina agarilytica TaxID=1087449 RepID=UPI000287AFA6|nr:thioredoxin family protein [Aquimarina agarilytica]
MKKLLFSLFILISVTGFSQDLDWKTDLNTAKNLAKEQNKNILVYFTGSDWCAPCKQLKEDFFKSEKFIEKADKLVLLMVDLPFRQDIITPEQREKNEKLIKKYNPEKSFPTIIGLSSSGKVLNSISAYSSLRDTTGHFRFLESILK